MRIYGVDVTSTPSRSKPMAICHAELQGHDLRIQQVQAGDSFELLERMLTDKCYVAAMDFPFGLPRVFLGWAGWPMDWSGMVQRLGQLSRADWRELVAGFRAVQPVGHKHPKRKADAVTGSASPVNVIRPPVGLMLHAVAPRLLASGAHVPPVCNGDPHRVVVEGYPALVAEALIKTRRYKEPRAHDAKQVQQNRRRFIASLTGSALKQQYGLSLHLPEDLRPALLADDKGDLLDSVLCAVQAAWASRFGPPDYGMPAHIADPVEGCIADPLIGAAF
ncbi:MAG: hypothetical protein Alpg2KO_09270 [Alphaproteobacteria bacterium]